jgi:zinc protease
MQNDPVSEEEVARAVKQVRALFSYGSENITNQAFWMGYTEMFASHDWFLNFLPQLAAVTTEDVRRAAQEYLLPRNRVVGTYLPTEAKA